MIAATDNKKKVYKAKYQQAKAINASLQNSTNATMTTTPTKAITATQTLPQGQMKVVTRSSAPVTIPKVVGPPQPLNAFQGQPRTTRAVKITKKRDLRTQCLHDACFVALRGQGQNGPARNTRSQTKNLAATCSSLDIIPEEDSDVDDTVPSEAVASEDDISADDEDDPAELYNILADCLTEAEQDETEA